MRLVNLVALCGLVAGCSAKATSAPPVHAASVVAEGAPRAPLPWAELTSATLARAKAQGKYVVLDGSAEWCHWCHVMEATTYHDPQVREILDAHFIAVKVDVDSRPDIEERYGDWGWPATVIFSPDATELGKYRGYIAPDKFAEILRDVVGSRVAERGAAPPVASKPPLPAEPMPEEQLAWIARFTEVELDEYWDEAQGGWGRTQKAPLGWDNAWALDQARRGDAGWRRRALFTLDRQSALVDPVWGGIYQYSAASDWDHPHFEKLMPFQAGALDNYAEAYALTKDAKYLALATKTRRYLESFLMSPEGGFFATQDADLNAHEPGKRFVNGHDYYALDDAHRRALGVPRVDAHEYGKENGLAISAYCTLYAATRDTAALAVAERAAKRILATHGTASGAISHDAHPEGATPHTLYLGDNATFGYALVRLHEATGRTEYLRAAVAIADFLVKDVADPRAGGFFASTVDPDAVGIFAVRRTPFEENTMAVRLLAKLAKADPSRADYRRAIGRTLRAIATPEEIKGRGRMLGDFLLALEETKGVRGG